MKRCAFITLLGGAAAGGANATGRTHAAHRRADGQPTNPIRKLGSRRLRKDLRMPAGRRPQPRIKSRIKSGAGFFGIML